MEEAIKKLDDAIDVQLSIMRRADFCGRLCAFTDAYYIKKRGYRRSIFGEYEMEAEYKIKMLTYAKNILIE